MITATTMTDDTYDDDNADDLKTVVAMVMVVVTVVVVMMGFQAIIKEKRNSIRHQISACINPPISPLITDSNGKVQKDLWNEGTKHKHVKYYYQDGEECKYCSTLKKINISCNDTNE